MFVDLTKLSDEQANMALGHIYKAIHDHDGDSAWAPHDSPFVQHLIELFTARGLTRLDGFAAEMADWLAGKKHHPGGSTLPHKPGMMRRWNPTELGLVRLYLEALPEGQWLLSDYEMLVEFMVQRYLPEDALRTEAQWLASKANLMGRVQANLEGLSLEQADTVLVALPASVMEATEQFTFTRAQLAALEFASARCVEYVVDLSAKVRKDMRKLVINHAEAQMLGVPHQGSLQTALMDKFAAYNRDWRRIALTEAGNNALVGYIASLKPGTKVRRSERYKGACAFCRAIDGRVMTVVEPDKKDKNPDTEVWVGKDNFGRSMSPLKRVDGALVERTASEMWHVPAGLVHPNCRGRWLPVIEDAPGDDPAFGDWLRATLGATMPVGEGKE